jgi:hypothetical protein
VIVTLRLVPPAMSIAGRSQRHPRLVIVGLNERSTTDGESGPSQRSGAPRSSSPAMPTSVNRA